MSRSQQVTQSYQNMALWLQIAIKTFWYQLLNKYKCQLEHKQQSVSLV